MYNYLLAYLIIGALFGIMACLVDGKKTIRNHSWASFIIALILLIFVWPVAMMFNCYVYYKIRED